jgi:hypothetical protein
VERIGGFAALVQIRVQVVQRKTGDPGGDLAFLNDGIASHLLDQLACPYIWSLHFLGWVRPHPSNLAIESKPDTEMFPGQRRPQWHRTRPNVPKLDSEHLSLHSCDVREATKTEGFASLVQAASRVWTPFQKQMRAAGLVF